MSNAYVSLVRLLPNPPLLLGTITSVHDTLYDVSLPGGNTVRARGNSGMTVGLKVFVRNGAIEGEAPNLPVSNIEV